MNFPMFSCSHFLSNRTQNIMSMRTQESKTEEGPAVAKPRPISSVSRYLLRAKKTSSIDSCASGSPGYQWVGSEFRLKRPQGNRCQAEAKSGNKMTIGFEAEGNLCGVVRVQEAQGNWCEVSITSLKGQCWNTTMCQSPTVDTL